MDDLDRVAARVARTVRTSYPHWMDRGFTLTDLEERLAPFHETRRELSGGADSYEQTLLRLLAGERGYLEADPALRSASAEALRLPSPTVALVRPWSSTTLRLRATPAVAAAPTGHGGTMAGTAGAAHHGAGAQRVTAVPHCGCRYCGGTLPEGRTLTFCPYCGQNLSVRQCPACSTELELAWRFCVTCGRGTANELDTISRDSGGQEPSPAYALHDERGRSVSRPAA